MFRNIYKILRKVSGIETKQSKTFNLKFNISLYKLEICFLIEIWYLLIKFENLEILETERRKIWRL